MESNNLTVGGILGRTELEVSAEGSSGVASGKKSVLNMFREMADELDRRHAKYERIVRHSRDITIESKKIIFLLHRSRHTEADILDKAESRFQDLENGSIRELAKELQNEDPYYYIWAFSPGLQEYTEARAVHYFLKCAGLISYENLMKFLVFEIKLNEERTQNINSSYFGYGYGRRNNRNFKTTGSKAKQETMEDLGTSSTSDCEVKPHPDVMELPTTRTVAINFSLPDFILGICDLTGELMRVCVSAAGEGNSEYVLSTSVLVQKIYQALIGIHSLRRDAQNKLQTMLNSVKKMEVQCYQLKTRKNREIGWTPSVGFDDDLDSGLDL